MLKKIFISIFSTVVMIITGIGGANHLKNDNSVEVNEVEAIQEQTANNTLEEKVEESNEIVEVSAEKVYEEVKNTTDEVKNNNTEKKNTTNKSVENKETSTATSNKIQSNCQDSICQTKQEKTKNTQNVKTQSNNVKENVTEDYFVYNSNATQKIISDINEIAKKNTDLWDANGNKLYKIKTTSEIVGNNYMSPYRKSMVEGVVLNTFPVTFLVYAQDHIRTGFTTETRYYIDITEY